MNREENNLLAKWLDGTTSKSELIELDKMFDLNMLSQDISKLDLINLNGTPTEDCWKVLQQKIKSNAQNNEVDLFAISA
jgi:hypothetical protein